MNFVSIILYLGTVIDKMMPIAVATMIGSLFLVGALSLYIADVNPYQDTMGTRKGRKVLIWIAIASAFVVIFTPSSEILYLIAASELGEEVITNPEVVEVATELKNIIIDKIKAVGE